MVTPLEPGFDQPSTVAEQLRWLTAAGLRPRVAWARRDLAVLAAARKRAPSEDSYENRPSTGLGRLASHHDEAARDARSGVAARVAHA